MQLRIASSMIANLLTTSSDSLAKKALNWDNMGHWIEEKKDKYLMNTRNVGEGDQSCEEASDIDFDLDSDSDF